MTKEFEVSPNSIETIPQLDQEVILLAPIFFYAKYLRRKINTEGYAPVAPPVDFKDPISVLLAGLDLHRQANSDIDGDVVGAVSRLVSSHPVRDELFPHLTDNQINDVCHQLNEIFENQEFCAQCESWSHYDSSPEIFALSVADEMLWLRGREMGLSWYSDIYGRKNRQPIMLAILSQKLPKKTRGLLPFEPT